MTVTFYPKGLLITAVFLLLFGATLALAVDAKQAAALAGAVSVAAYLLVELFIMFNPAVWWRERANGHH